MARHPYIVPGQLRRHLNSAPRLRVFGDAATNMQDTSGATDLSVRRVYFSARGILADDWAHWRISPLRALVGLNRETAGALGRRGSRAACRAGPSGRTAAGSARPV